VPREPGIFVQEQGYLDEVPAAFFLQNVLQLHQHKYAILRTDSLEIWKVINEEHSVLIPKNRNDKFSRRLLHTEFLGRCEPLCRHSIDYCIVFGSFLYNRFHLWPTIATGNHLRRPEKIPKFAQMTGTVDVSAPYSGVSEPTSRRASACQNLQE